MELQNIRSLTENELINLIYNTELNDIELQYVIETLNQKFKIENEKFKNFQVLLEKDINITTNIN